MKMNESKILTSIEECKKYFKLLNLHVETSEKTKQLTIKKFSADYNNQLFYNKGDYNKLYTIAMENQDFDFHIPFDNGIFQFYSEKVKKEIVAIHYIFYSNPKDIESIKDLINEKQLEENNNYYDLLDLADFKNNVLYFRFDFDKNLYNKIIHSIAHLHIGFDNEIRIPLDKILTPEAFVDFVVKYAYKETWQNAFKNNTNFAERIKVLTSQCEKLNNNLFSSNENKILHLT